MTAQYLGLAMILAITLNHADRFVHAAGALRVAVGLNRQRMCVGF